MVTLLKFLAYKSKATQPSQKPGGFTLIELLVGMILAALIITPLLGFMVNILQSDRQEQAKATSEQEIQAGLEYIARDLDQAVFIYDGAGLAQIQDDLPTAPAGTQGAPVLAFWKRKFLPQSVAVGGARDDAYTYSLVTYYLLKDTNCSGATWSCTGRIARVELLADIPTGVTGYTRDIPLFNLSPPAPLASQPLEQKLNAWPNGAATNYSNVQFPILIDYIDNTPAGAANPNIPVASCPTTPRNPSVAGAPNYLDRLVPPTASQTGFYACVDTDKNQAKVFLRGNALARIRSKTNPPEYKDPSDAAAQQSSYFPSASIQVKGRGFLGDNQDQ